MTTISLLNWMLLSTLLLGAWWLCYHLTLRQERSFKYNRSFLVLGPLLAASLPLLPLTWPTGWGAAPALPGGLPTMLLPAVQVGAHASADPDWAEWLRTAYAAGAALLLARLAYGLGKLWQRVRRLPAEAHPSYRLLRTGGQLPISSFGKTVFWDETLPLSAAEARQVLAHELAHVRQGHTYDHLLLELLRALLWFNPFVHLCGRALALTHEFLADEAALRPETAAAPAALVSRSYAHLLARQVASHLGFSAPLAHSFFQSQTLARITMIHQQNPVRRWKQWLALPLLSALLLTVACERNKEAVAPAAPPVPTVQLQNDRPAPPPPPAVYAFVEKYPELPGGGGQPAIVQAIQNNLQYPKVAPNERRTGRAFVSFIVTDQGEVQAVNVVKGLGAAYDAAVVAAIRKLPRFVPGRQDGKAVNVSFTVPVQFVER